MEIVTLLRNQIFFPSRVKDYDRDIFPGGGVLLGGKLLYDSTTNPFWMLLKRKKIDFVIE